MERSTSHLRADAAANRTRVIKAAREAFAQHGLEVPLTEIARRAGVGVATVYRRFPTRATLVAEAFSAQMRDCSLIFEQAARNPDPWAAFCEVVHIACEIQIANRGFATAFSYLEVDGEFDAAREDALASFARLTVRAQRAGQLRRDFVPQDLFLLLLANAGIAGSRQATSSQAAQASRRFVAYFLQSLGAPGSASLPPPAALPPDALDSLKPGPASFRRN